jgi:hypothetical protein
MENKALEELLLRYAKTGTPFHENMNIVSGLHIEGENAVNFVAEYADIFGVDITGFHFDKYFGDNTEGLLPLLVGDLEKAIEARKLDDELISVKNDGFGSRPAFSLKGTAAGIALVVVVAALLSLVIIFL